MSSRNQIPLHWNVELVGLPMLEIDDGRNKNEPQANELEHSCRNIRLVPPTPLVELNGVCRRWTQLTLNSRLHLNLSLLWNKTLERFEKLLLRWSILSFKEAHENIQTKE